MTQPAADHATAPAPARKAVNRPKLRTPHRVEREKKKKLRRITKAEQRGDFKTATYLQEQYLKSYYVARDAVIAVSKNAPKHHKLDAEAQHALAERVNVFAPCAEPVTVRPIPKKGGTRTIHSYGTEHRVRQRIVRDALTPSARQIIGPNQYAGLPGRGRNKLIDDLMVDLRRRAATKSGKAAKGRKHYSHVAVMDIRDAFGSMVSIADFLTERGILPKEVAEHVVGCTHEVHRTPDYVIRPQPSSPNRSTRSPQEEAARAAERLSTPRNRQERRNRSRIGSRLRRTARATPQDVGSRAVPSFTLAVPSITQVDFHPVRHGLPQGAATSSIAAEIAIASVLSKVTLPKGVVLKTFADDLVILGRAYTDVTAAVMALRSAFKRARVGTLELRTVTLGRITKGFDFVGYRLRRRHGRLEAKPIPKRIAGLMARLYATLLRLEGGIADRRDDLRRLIRSWRSAFRAADTTDTVAWILMGAQRVARSIPVRVTLGNIRCEVGGL